jgi:hypothetical protein
MTEDFNPAELSALFDEIGSELAVADDGNVVLESLVHLATRRVDGAEHAGITVGRAGDSFRTIAATADLVLQADGIQYDLGSGPCVDAIIGDTTFNAEDLRTDARWPEFGRLCFERTGIVSMLSMRFYIESDRELVAGLNLYAREPAAFDERSEAVTRLLTTHGSVAVARAAAEAKSRNLLQALRNSREIGVAMGIVMAREKVTRDEAFNLLRIASQHSHRKVADIATEVADTGMLPPGAGPQRT